VQGPVAAVGSPAAADPLIADGTCAVCGKTGTFERTPRPTRESFACRSCRASLRYRCQARALVSVLGGGDVSLRELARKGGLADLDVYEPGVIGPFRRLLRKRCRYVQSYPWPGVAPGASRDGVRCEDLQALTFPDASFDLVITSDVFEHVRDPQAGFAEVHRVLRPGGSHVFTVPVAWPLPATTTARVDTTTDEDVHLLPPQYHGSPHDPQGSLVYTDFGMDLPESLRGLGFTTAVHHGYRNALTFVATRPPDQAGS
jgi:SAM-dependent methyltransferase